MSACRACQGKGWYWTDDGGDCVAKELCTCEAGRHA